ncbi:hypothetical protein [Cupriavidus metallidurans]|uniref:hypothetical protein n=1 Tax=Cupriavidus metallidurans TaxID=119219 RepID=UPI003CFC94AF
MTTALPKFIADDGLEQMNHLDNARLYVERQSSLPGVFGPYVASSITWKGRRFYYAAGRDSEGRRRLAEVFRVKTTGELEPVPAYEYPPPFADQFPADMASIFHPDPWGGKVQDLTVSQLADGLRTMMKEDASPNCKKLPRDDAVSEASTPQ